MHHTATALQPRAQRRANPAGQHAGPGAGISLRTMPPATTGAPPSFHVLDARGNHVATLTWREFASDYGWQCRLARHRRTLRKCYPTLVDALVEQGGFRRDDAQAAVAGNAEAMAEDAP